MNNYGFSSWQVFTRCGATPQFKFAGSGAIAKSYMPRKDGDLLWQASLKVMRQWALDNGNLNGWLRQAETIHANHIAHDPLVVWFLALFASAGLPDYPLQTSYGNDDTICLDSACPYDAATQLALQLTSDLLGWSHAALSLKRVSLPVGKLQAWMQAYLRLPALLPPEDVMLFHRHLWERGISWEWLGGERTRAGQGVKQQVFQKVPSLPIAEPEALRIPIYTVTGSVGKTTTARLLVQLLRHSGKRLAFAASDGAWIGEERVLEGDCIGGVTAIELLKQPQVEGAVFEQGRGGMIRQGVPYACSDVAVLLNVQEVHLGLDNIHTIEDMADAKAIGLQPARLAILNMDDAQCRRLGEKRAAGSCVWFSVSASPDLLRTISGKSTGSLGVERNESGEPQALHIWQGGRVVKRLSLENVKPYHGFLGEKTLEELLAAVGAAWFGPLPVPGWDGMLPTLRLDNGNHLFRSSVHLRGDVVFVLDKAGEKSSLVALEEVIECICREEGIVHRIAVICRAASEPLDLHLESCDVLHRFMDEFICFDRPDTYTSKVALPCYAPGSIPELLAGEFLRINARSGMDKAVHVVAGWDVAESLISERLSAIKGKTLVLVNQPSTGKVSGLNQSIVNFVTRQDNAP